QISELANFESVFSDFDLLLKMVRTANKAGAITTTKYGAIAALPHKSQLID
ncbi:MAG: carbohydrate kinase, partial [Muricauda sp.]|nr:carbohydrate kinase [Allomuricauda sp.]